MDAAGFIVIFVIAMNQGNREDATVSSEERNKQLHGAERRRCPRKHLTISVRVTDEGGSELGQVGDLAQGGMTLVHRSEVGVGQKLSLTLRLPESMAQPEPLKLQGICRWASNRTIRHRCRCGIEFTAMTPEKHEVLKTLIQRFAGELSWEFRHEGDKLVVVMSGSLDEKALLDELVQEIDQPVCLDLADLRRINSHGVLLWSQFLQRIAATGAIELRRCSPAFVSRLNVIAGFQGPAKVVSVNMPFICVTCEAERTVEMSIEDAALDAELPQMTCERCAARMTFDELKEHYFAFLGHIND
jgi:ABC-type transporter Mla MlaB component